jgi:hypothetical protein
MITLNGAIAEGTYRAATTIESDGSVQTETSVHLRAGTSIRLTSGFHAEAGSDFTARIEDCDPIVEESMVHPAGAVALRAEGEGAALRVFPNPFSNQVKIIYEIPDRAEVEIRLIGMDGKVRQLFNPQTQSAGTHELEWADRHLPAGVYLIQLRSNETLYNQRLVKLR